MSKVTPHTFTDIGSAAAAVVSNVRENMDAQIITPEQVEERATTRTAARVLAPTRPASLQPTPAEMLAAAINQGASIDTLERLIALQERWEKGNARKAFDAAISDAKAKIPAIVKNVKGHTNKYADLAAITTVVDPILSEHGLSYRFRTDQSDKITVTCILSHRDGHSEENSLSGAPDTGPGRNAIQAVGSTVKYLMRYTLTLSIGIATTENDDDGRLAGSGETITPEQVAELKTKIAAVGANEANFLKHMKVESLDAMPMSKFGAANAALDAKKLKAAKDAANG